MNNSSDSVLALDVGEKRIGVARASLIARLPEPLCVIDRVIEQSKDTLQSLLELVSAHNAALVVVGLPRGLKGQETPQTGSTRKFIAMLEKELPIPIYTQDEALTSKKAEAELQERGIQYNKGSVDALAATYILEDFLGEHPELSA